VAIEEYIENISSEDGMLYFDLMSTYNEEVSLETVIPGHFPVLERFHCVAVYGLR
jgi:hypothetical protein